MYSNGVFWWFLKTVGWPLRYCSSTCHGIDEHTIHYQLIHSMAACQSLSVPSLSSFCQVGVAEDQNVRSVGLFASSWCSVMQLYDIWLIGSATAWMGETRPRRDAVWWCSVPQRAVLRSRLTEARHVAVRQSDGHHTQMHA